MFGSPAFHLHQRRATRFLSVAGVPGAKMHERMPVQYENNVVSQHGLYGWTGRCNTDQQLKEMVHAFLVSQPKMFIPVNNSNVTVSRM
jgi:hypothetical protein